MADDSEKNYTVGLQRSKADDNSADLSFIPEDLAFLKRAIRIEDEEELKAHIKTVQAEALMVHKYPCIQRFAFAR